MFSGVRTERRRLLPEVRSAESVLTIFLKDRLAVLAHFTSAILTKILASFAKHLFYPIHLQMFIKRVSSAVKRATLVTMMKFKSL